MPRTRKPRRDDPEESERFIAIARELEADQTGKVFKRSMADIVRHKRRSPVASKQREK